MNRRPPVDSHHGDPTAPYRCQELRDDADRVILGRAAPELVARYDAHRRGCDSCAQFHAVMAAAYAVPHAPSRVSDRQLDREFRGVLDKLEDERRRPVLAWTGASVLAAAAVMLFALLWLKERPAVEPAAQEIVLEEGRVSAYRQGATIPDRVGAFGHRAQAFGRVFGGTARLHDGEGKPVASQSFVPGTVLIADGSDAQLALFGRVLVNLQDGAVARWSLAAHDMIELSLERGRLAVRYDRDPSDPLLQIRTPEAIVRVVGTVFTVEVDDKGHTIVGVLRGQVQVLHPGTGARIATVDAGYRYDVSKTTFADISRVEVATALPLGEPDAVAPGNVPSRWVVPGLPEAPEQRSLSHVPDPQAAAIAAKTRRLIRKRRGPVAPVTAPDEGADLITDLVAQAERDRRHAVQAALEHCRSLYMDAETRPRAPRCLERFMREYAREPEAVEGLLLIGMLRMDYAHDYQAATLKFEAFLRRAPNHPRAELAMYKLTLAAIESGQIGRAVQRGQAYLDRYPNGRYVGHILQRFPELGRDL